MTDDEAVEPKKCKHGVAMDKRCEDCEYDAWWGGSPP